MRKTVIGLFLSGLWLAACAPATSPPQVFTSTPAMEAETPVLSTQASPNMQVTETPQPQFEMVATARPTQIPVMQATPDLTRLDAHSVSPDGQWYAESDLVRLEFRISRVDGSMAWGVPYKEIFSKKEFASNLGGVRAVYWSPDSRFVYFVPQLCCWNPPVVDDLTSRLLRMDTQNGLVEVLFSGINYISFSDQYLVRVIEFQSPIKIAINRQADGQTKELTLIAPPSYRQAGKILWAPDGKRFLVVAAYGIKYGDTGPYDMQTLILVNIETEQQTIITQDVNGAIVPISWALDDTITYQTLYEGTLNKPVTWTQNLGTGFITRFEDVIQTVDLTQRIRQCERFAIHRSPDKKWLICGYNSPFEVIDVKNQIILPVDLTSLFGKQPQGVIQPFNWSSNGKYLYFGILPETSGVTASYVNTAAVLRMDLVTGQVIELIPHKLLPDGQYELFHASISPSGKKLAYSSRQNDVSTLHVTDMTSGATRHYNINATFSVIGKFTWSPDSTKMVFLAAETNAAGLVRQTVYLLEEKRNPVRVVENLDAFLVIEGISNNKVLRLYSPIDKTIKLLDLTTNQTQFLGVATPSQ